VTRQKGSRSTLYYSTNVQGSLGFTVMIPDLGVSPKSGYFHAMMRYLFLSA
jgi:hypothetical protein